MPNNLEPRYNIRFVEKVGTKTEVQEITKFPTIVGHEGNIKPLICNGKISKKHCTVTYDINDGVYRITDGIEGRPSTNHIYFGDHAETVITLKAELSKPRQAVFLIRLHDGTEAYLELYDPRDLKTQDPRSTQDLDPALLRTNAIAVEAHKTSEKNAVRLEVLDGKLQFLFSVFDYLGNNPRKSFFAISLIALMVLIGLPTVAVWTNLKAISDMVIQEQIQRREQKYNKP